MSEQKIVYRPRNMGKSTHMLSMMAGMMAAGMHGDMGGALESFTGPRRRAQQPEPKELTDADHRALEAARQKRERKAQKRNAK